MKKRKSFFWRPAWVGTCNLTLARYGTTCGRAPTIKKGNRNVFCPSAFFTRCAKYRRFGAGSVTRVPPFSSCLFRPSPAPASSSIHSADAAWPAAAARPDAPGPSASDTFALPTPGSVSPRSRREGCRYTGAGRRRRERLGAMDGRRYLAGRDRRCRKKLH